MPSSHRVPPLVFRQGQTIDVCGGNGDPRAGLHVVGGAVRVELWHRRGELE